MKVHESIDVDVPPRDVWPHIADPQRMADWHAKLVTVDRRFLGPARVGERFGTLYTMSGRELKATAEVFRFEPWTTFALRHHFRHKGRDRYVDETFQLWPQAAGTRVEQTVDFAGAGIPWWARSLMWFIARTGKPMGEGILAPLKRACEARANSTTS
jgi:hypothetical protein